MQITASEIPSGTAIGVAIRPLAPTDREALAEAFSRLSDETRRRRFRGLATQLGDRDLDWLTQIDHHNHEALVAIATDSRRVGGRRPLHRAAVRPRCGGGCDRRG